MQSVGDDYRPSRGSEAVSVSRSVAAAAVALALFVGFAGTLRAQTDTTDAVERRVKRERSGAGLRAGMWAVPSIGTLSNSSWPMLEGYFQKGLDQHLVL